MVRILGTPRGYYEPREITSKSNLDSESSENGWLIRFFDSSFFCEWIAVSYLYKHDHSGVRDYLCNRMYTLPLQGIENYLFQVCYMMIHKPSPSLDKFVIDVCAKSLKIALKVHWFLLAELEDSDDSEGISRIQEKCQIASTLMGEWQPLIRPQGSPWIPGGKNQVLNKIFTSKQPLLSITSSPPPLKSFSFSPSSGSNFNEDCSPQSPDENKLFKKFMPGPKVRDALLFRKSVDRDDDDSEKDGFLKRLLRDSKGEDELGQKIRDAFLFRKSTDKYDEDSEKDNLFKRLLRDSRGDEEDSGKDGFFKRLLRDNKGEDLASSSEGFFKKLFCDSKNDSEDKPHSKTMEEEEKEGFFSKFFREKFEDKKDGYEEGDNANSEEKGAKPSEEDEKDGFFWKFFKDKLEGKKDANEKIEEGSSSFEEEEPSEFSLFKRLIRVHPEDGKSSSVNEISNGGLFESSPGTEDFFRKLFRDRDRSFEDSELWGSKKQKEHLGTPKQQNEKSGSKPPLLVNPSQFRKGAYHESLDFVLTLCQTSYWLVDIFPVEHRKLALHESLAEINLHLTESHNTGGVCFPLGKGMYRVLHIPEDDAVLLNSREKAPYMICIEVLRCELPSNSKEASSSQKVSRGGIPLAKGDALLQKPPPWAYPLKTVQEGYRNSNDRMSRSTAQAIDQAMTHASEAKFNFVSVKLSVEAQLHCQPEITEVDLHVGSRCPAHDSDVEWVHVVLTTEPRVRMEDIEEQAPQRWRVHRRVPSTVAMEEVKAAAAKGEAPLGLPLKGAGQDSSDSQPRANGITPKASDALSGELWEAKKERIRKESIHGNLPGWDLISVIVKSGDDCRQEHLAVQLISHFYDIFQEAGLPLWLRPYEVLCTSSYTALIETIPDTASLHSIKSRYPNDGYDASFIILLNL